MPLTSRKETSGRQVQWWWWAISPVPWWKGTDLPSAGVFTTPWRRKDPLKFSPRQLKNHFPFPLITSIRVTFRGPHLVTQVECFNSYRKQKISKKPGTCRVV